MRLCVVCVQEKGGGSKFRMQDASLSLSVFNMTHPFLLLSLFVKDSQVRKERRREKIEETPNYAKRDVIFGRRENSFT